MPKSPSKEDSDYVVRHMHYRKGSHFKHWLTSLLPAQSIYNYPTHLEPLKKLKETNQSPQPNHIIVYEICKPTALSPSLENGNNYSCKKKQPVVEAIDNALIISSFALSYH